MNLDKTYRVTLYDNQNNNYVQYIDAEDGDTDAVIAKAKKTFQAHLYGLADKNKGSELQRCCPLTKLRGRLMFGFAGGHITLDVTGKTIFEAMNEAKQHEWIKKKGGKITEITSPLFYREEYPNHKKEA